MNDPAGAAAPSEHAAANASRALDHALASGIAWTALLRWSAQLVSWIGTLYAARILLPSDYGLVAMAMLAIGMARMIEDFGMDAILVQDSSLVGALRDRLAGFLLILGLLICVLFVLLSVPIARFFGEPDLAFIVASLSALFIVDALQVVPRAQLQRDLQFRRLGVVAFAQVGLTQLTLVVSANAGLGYWSLVLNTLVGTTAVTFLLVWWRPYRIAWPRDVAGLAAPLLQGWRILASRVAWYGYSNADQIIIGKVLGKDLLGPYTFATTFSSLAQQEVGSIVSKVVPGIFSQLQSRPGELRRYFLLLTEFLAVLSFPMSIGLALVADLVIPLLLGPRWNAVIVPLQLLCIYSVFYSSQILVSHVLMWTGQFRVNMWCSIAAGVTLPVAFLIGVDHGLAGIGWAWVLVYPIVSIPAMVFAFRTLQASFWHWLAALKPAIVGNLVMAAAIIGLRAALPEAMPLAARSALAITTGAIVYPAVLWFLFRPRVRQLLAVARQVRSGATADVS